jgi:hypothetical protein
MASEIAMATGIIEHILIRRYGPAEAVVSPSGVDAYWRRGESSLNCHLYGELVWSEDLRQSFGTLEVIYGNKRGGFLMHDWFRIATLVGPPVFGLYEIRALQSTPEVRRANQLDPDICFFMDSANVSYYGVRDGILCCYDTDPADLYSLGPIRQALESLLEEFELSLADDKTE